MKKNNRKNWLILSGVALLIVILIVAGLNGQDKGIEVTLGRVIRQTVTETIPANGKIRPVTEVKISPDVSGEIIELNYQEGDRVRKGDLLIKIRQDLYLSAVDRAEASLNAVKAQYFQQKAQLIQIGQNYRRTEQLFKEKAVPESEYETAFSQYEVAKEQLKAAEYNIKSAEASLKEARENLIKTTIYAPMDGIVSKLNVEKGERVVGTSQMAGTEMMRIADFDQMEVLVDVNENDIIRLKQNDTAQIEVDAYPDRQFTGIVTQIANSAKNTGTTLVGQVTNFEVRINILPDSYRDLQKKASIPFRPGMSASVSIRTETRSGVLTVPLQAVTTRNDLKDTAAGTEGSEEKIIQRVFVYDSEASTVRSAKIKTGLQDMNRIEVTDGLSDSLLIVTGPYNAINRQLKNNTAVRARNVSEQK